MKNHRRLERVFAPVLERSFYTPRAWDNTTQEYKEASDKLPHFLPASFALIYDTPETFVVANLELNPDLVKSIKRIPLYKKPLAVKAITWKSILLAASNSLKIIQQVSYNIKTWWY